MNESKSNSPGTKYDGNKSPLSMLPYGSLKAIAAVMEHGRKKYGRDNWRKGIEWSRVVDAALRHIGAFYDGERIDPESGLSHLAHAGCNVLFFLST